MLLYKSINQKETLNYSQNLEWLYQFNYCPVCKNINTRYDDLNSPKNSNRSYISRDFLKFQCFECNSKYNKKIILEISELLKKSSIQDKIQIQKVKNNQKYKTNEIEKLIKCARNDLTNRGISGKNGKHIDHIIPLYRIASDYLYNCYFIENKESHDENEFVKYANCKWNLIEINSEDNIKKAALMLSWNSAFSLFKKYYKNEENTEWKDHLFYRAKLDKIMKSNYMEFGKKDIIW
jgi:hypothetical protein